MTDWANWAKEYRPRVAACEHCGKDYTKRSGNVRFCSEGCRFEARFGRRTCEECEGSFIPRKATSRFCSVECWRAYQGRGATGVSGD